MGPVSCADAGAAARSAIAAAAQRAALRDRSGVSECAVVGGDARDLLGGPLELLVRENRGALERQVAGDLQPRAASAVVVADADCHGARDPVRPQQQYV